MKIRHKLNKSLIIFLILVQGVLALGLYRSKGQNTDEKDTVISSYSLEFSKVKRIEGIYPLGWLDEENIIIKKENKSKGLVEKEDGLKGYPVNIYKYNIKTGEERVLIEAKKDIEYAVVSPNRKNIFYEEGSELTGTGYIHNLASNKAIQITEQDEIPLGIGRWTDDNSVILFSYTKGVVFTVSVNGDKREIVPKTEGFMRDPIRVGDKVYYVSNDYKLYKYDLATKKTELLLQELAEYIPSRDGLHFASVPLGRKGIDLRDENGEKKIDIYDGVGVGGFSWSPCGNKLAYLVSDKSGKGDSLFVASLSSGKSVKVAENIPQSFPYIFWSPSGRKLLIPAYEKNDDKQKFIALLIEIE